MSRYLFVGIMVVGIISAIGFSRLRARKQLTFNKHKNKDKNKNKNNVLKYIFLNVQTQWTDKSRNANLSYIPRANVVLEKIRESDPDVIGLVELGVDQAIYFDEMLKNNYNIHFSSTGRHSSDKDYKDEQNFALTMDDIKQKKPYVGEILFLATKKSTINEIGIAKFASLPEGLKHARGILSICVSFHDTMLKLGVSHLDHLSSTSRKNSFEFINLDINYSDMPVIIALDSNHFYNQKPDDIKYLTDNGVKIAFNMNTHSGIVGTYIGCEITPDIYKSSIVEPIAGYKDASTLTTSNYHVIDFMVHSNSVRSIRSTHVPLLMNKIEGLKYNNLASDHCLIECDFMI